MKITEINVYPVKSLRGYSVERAAVEERGLQFDRRWMVVDSDGSLVTQREYPVMATLTVSNLRDSLIVSANGLDNGEFPLVPGGRDRIKVRVWNSYCDALVMGDRINRWFSNVLQSDCRLVYMPEDSKRQINPLFNRGNDTVSFADGYPFLLTNESSLDVLNDKMSITIPMNRFRPNLVVSGAEGFAEDNWQRIRIGKTIFRVAKPCDRCVVTTIDQDRGISVGKEPLATLARFRSAGNLFGDTCGALGLEKTAVVFGENLIAENPGGEIRVGDPVEVMETRH